MDGSVEGLTVEVRDRVEFVTIDREERRNALSVAMRQAIERICADVDDDPDVDVLVLRAIGPVFCAGADLTEIRELGGALPPTDPGAALRRPRSGQRPARRAAGRDAGAPLGPPGAARAGPAGPARRAEAGNSLSREPPEPGTP